MTHGILSNGTVEIPATLRQETTNYIHVVIDGDNGSLIGFLREDWTFTPDAPVEPDLPYGVYATTTRQKNPESSILWRYSPLAGWRSLNNSDQSTYHNDHPRDFYANRLSGNWWDLIVRLTAEEQ